METRPEKAQTTLSHKFIDAMLGYARRYEGPVAVDYHRAMAKIESRFSTALPRFALSATEDGREKGRISGTALA